MIAVFVCELMRKLVVFMQHRRLRAQPRGNGVEYRRLGIELRLLRDQREFELRLAPQLAVVEREFSGDDF
jgi:hypothetical protein